jgi:hypothetical protein
LRARADEPATVTDAAERSSIDDDDDGVLLNSTSVRQRDDVEDRMKELGAQRAWLVQSLKNWSWSPGDSFKDQSVLGILMNLKMAAHPCLETAAVRHAGIRHLNEELSRVDLELAALTAIRALADLALD